MVTSYHRYVETANDAVEKLVCGAACSDHTVGGRCVPSAAFRIESTLSVRTANPDGVVATRRGHACLVYC